MRALRPTFFLSLPALFTHTREKEGTIGVGGAHVCVRADSRWRSSADQLEFSGSAHLRPAPSAQSRRGARERNSTSKPPSGSQGQADSPAVSRLGWLSANSIPLTLTRNKSPGSTCPNGAARSPVHSLAGEAEDCDPRFHRSDRAGETAQPGEEKGQQGLEAKRTSSCRATQPDRSLTVHEAVLASSTTPRKSG